MKLRSVIPFVLVSMLIGCSSGTRSIDLEEPSRLLGKENDVRVDAQVFASRFTPNGQVGITWSVENLRPEPILIADIVPETSYDPDTYEITINLGSEVPGNEFLPSLIQIRSGEKRTFETATRLEVTGRAQTIRRNWPRSLRVRLSFLKDVEPFGELVGLPEKALHDPALADELFLPWVSSHLVVRTNSIPINWVPSGSAGDDGSVWRRSTLRAPRPPQ